MDATGIDKPKPRWVFAGRCYICGEIQWRLVNEESSAIELSHDTVELNCLCIQVDRSQRPWLK